MIDDISVIVIQIDFLQVFSDLNEKVRKGVPLQRLLSIAGDGKRIAAKGDPIRGSFVPAREIARRRIDPKRGSYVTEGRNIEEIEVDLAGSPIIIDLD